MNTTIAEKTKFDNLSLRVDTDKPSIQSSIRRIGYHFSLVNLEINPLINIVMSESQQYYISIDQVKKIQTHLDSIQEELLEIIKRTERRRK